MYIYRKVPSRPSIRIDKEFAAECDGAVVAGVDEAGRGPLAGPVVAAAVVLCFNGRRPIGLRDSKQMTEKERERVFPTIMRQARCVGVGIATAQEIDLLNILEATRLASARAVTQLSPPCSALVTDALEIPELALPTLPLVKGDAISASIAAASIIAKVTRDRLMNAYAEEFPEYGWQTNRGYPTAEHYAALENHGPTILHRMTFNGVGFFNQHQKRSPTFLEFERELEAPPCAEFLKVCLTRLQECRHRLPPPDFVELTMKIERLIQGDSECSFMQ